LITNSFLFFTASGPLIQTATQHPKGEEGLDKIKKLDKKDDDKRKLKPVAPGQPPKFKTPFNNLVDMSEGDLGHSESLLEPIGDPSMKVSWTFNGEPIQAG